MEDIVTLISVLFFTVVFITTLILAIANEIKGIEFEAFESYRFKDNEKEMKFSKKNIREHKILIAVYFGMLVCGGACVVAAVINNFKVG